MKSVIVQRSGHIDDDVQSSAFDANLTIDGPTAHGSAGMVRTLSCRTIPVSYNSVVWSP